jgi:uncharacterized damage-inducible protein DinB
MTTTSPEPWLRGPVPGVSPLLQPAAHAFLMAREDVERAMDGLTADQLWARPGGVASLGFHLAHLSGSTDRLLTYARGETLSDKQKAALTRERTIAEERPALGQLIDDWRDAVASALAQLASTPDAALTEPRGVGRVQLPSTVLGLLFHAAEHAARHTGQIVTTAKLVRS